MALIKKVYEDSVTVGEVKSISGSALPSNGNWLFCDGTAYDSVANPEYAALYAIIGNTYGGVDGTDFQVPDLRAEFIRGLDDMGGPAGAKGVDAGRGLGTAQGDQYGDHSHPQGTLTASTVNVPHDHPNPSTSTATRPHTHPNTTRIGIGGPGQVVSASPTFPIRIDDSPSNTSGSNSIPHSHATPTSGGTDNAPHGHPISGATGPSGSTETRARNVAIKYIIKF